MAYGSDTSTALINKLRSDVDGLNVRVALLQDLKPSGTNGGSFTNSLTADTTYITADSTEYTADQTSVTWSGRGFNEVDDESGIIVRHSGSTFTLDVGWYKVRAVCNFYGTLNTKLKLQNLTFDETEAVGNNAYIPAAQMGVAEVTGLIYPRRETTYTVAFRVESAGANCLGVANSFAGDPEVYSTIEVMRINHLKPD